MVNVTSVNLPAPADWQAFERLTRDLFESEWQTDDARANGRSGQEQHGVDVYGTDRVHKKWVGVQCKGRSGGYGKALKEKDLREEVEKAKSFHPPLDRFILATTAPNDARIQEVARELNEKNRKELLFEVDVMGWDEIKAVLNRHPRVAAIHCSGVSTVADLQISAAMNDLRGDVSRDLAGLTSSILDLQRSVVAGLEREPTGDALGQRITDAADLLNDSPAQTAITRLERLLENEGRTASARDRFRIKANLGSAHFAKGDKDAAVDWYRQAHDEYPDTSEALSILAAAESIAGNREKAAELAASAMAMREPQQRAAGVFLETAPAETQWQELQAQLPEQFQRIPEFLLALAEHAQKAGQIKDCRRLTKDAVNRDPDNWRVRAYAGYLRFQEVAERDDIRSLRLVRKSDIEIVEDARAHFLVAWDLLQASGWAREAETCVMNALSASLMLGDEEKAEELIEEAFRRIGNTPQLLRFRAAYQMHKGEDAAVADALSRIPEGDRDPNDELMLLQARINEGDPEAALARADFLYRTAEDAGLRVAFGNCRILAAAQINPDLFKEVTHDILTEHPDSTLLLAYYVFNHPGDLDDPAVIDRLAKLSERETNSFARDRAAHALAMVGRNSEAADIYLDLCSPDTDTPQLRMALQTLVNCRRIREARELYGKLDARIKDTASMRRIGAVIFQCAGNLKGARKELEHVFGTGDETLEDRARWIDICERLPDISSIIRYLDTVPVDISGDPRMRMHLAHKLDHYTDDFQRALEIGYRALRDGYEDPQIHLGFMVGLILTGRSGRHVDFDHEVVEEDTVVVVSRDHADPLTKIIETAPAPRADRDEISPEDPLALRLMGKAVGDNLPMDSAIGKLNATVTKILSKYAHAYHRSQKDFERLFPESKIFGALRIDENDLEASIRPILESARERAGQVKRIEEAYESGKAPIALLAAAGGGTVFDFWDFLRHHGSIKIKMALGNAVERKAATQSAMAAPGVIVDPITLYGAQTLGFADTLLQACPDLHITQSSIDLLHEAYRDRVDAIGGEGRRGSFVADEHGARIIELSREMSDLLISDLGRTLDLARGLKIAMPEEGTALHPDFEAVFEDVGPCFVDTLVVAKERGWTLLADDTALRLFASLDGISSAWSQVALQIARNKRMISQEAYSDALGAMLEGNYRYVSIDGDTTQFEWERKETSLWLKQFLDHIALPTNAPWSVAQLIGSSLLELWDDTDDGARCVAYAAFMLEELSERLGEGPAIKMLGDSVAAAVAKAQRNARMIKLPPLLRSTTHIISPGLLAVDINRDHKDAVLNTIGDCVKSARNLTKMRSKDPLEDEGA